MIRSRDPRQAYLLDPWSHLGPKRRRLLEDSWAGLFRQEILPELPVEELAPCFCSDFGRPAKELYTVLGVILLQQMHDLTDLETVNHLAFNQQWHFALDIPSESDAAKYLCPKNLWTMRQKVTELALDTVIFQRVTGKLARVFQVDTERQRLDSVHVKSNMRKLGQAELQNQRGPTPESALHAGGGRPGGGSRRDFATKARRERSRPHGVRPFHRSNPGGKRGHFEHASRPMTPGGEHVTFSPVAASPAGMQGPVQ